MLEQLVRFSVRRRGLVLALAFLLVLLSIGAVKKLSIDAVPDVTNVQVSVLTSAPGLSPAEVEQYITFPIETALNGMPDVAEMLYFNYFVLHEHSDNPIQITQKSTSPPM